MGLTAVGLGRAWHGMARHDQAGHGMAGQDKVRTLLIILNAVLSGINKVRFDESGCDSSWLVGSRPG